MTSDMFGIEGDYFALSGLAGITAWCSQPVGPGYRITPLRGLQKRSSYATRQFFSYHVFMPRAGRCDFQ